MHAVTLFPYLADNKCWDKHFNLGAECFVLNIEGVELVQGAFVMPHFSEYLILGGLMKDCSEGAKHGPNSQRFLDMCDGLTSKKEGWRLRNGRTSLCNPLGTCHRE